MTKKNDKKEQRDYQIEILLPSILYIVFFLLAIPFAAKGFFHILKIELTFLEVFVAFILCTICVKWIRAMWGAKA